MQRFRDENIILEKISGFFAKLQGPRYFLDFLIYFPIGKSGEYVYGSWTGSVVVRVMGPWTFIKLQLLIRRWMTQI
jgi:hypothetical protein